MKFHKRNTCAREAFYRTDRTKWLANMHKTAVRLNKMLNNIQKSLDKEAKERNEPTDA